MEPPRDDYERAVKPVLQYLLHLVLLLPHLVLLLPQ
jgi:hypothetical protein